MAFVAAAQRAALAGVSWPTQGFDPQGRAQLSGLVTPEEGSADLTDVERRAAIAGISWPTTINTEFGRGVVSGVYVPDNAGPDVLIALFETAWTLIPTFTEVIPDNEGWVRPEMAAFTGSFVADSISQATVEQIKKLAFYHRMNMRDVTGQSVNITNTVFRRAHAR